jgi:RecJ-like exonuclease
MNKKPINKQRGFRPKPFSQNAEKVIINDLSLDGVGKIFILQGIVDGVSQTEGPTLFYLDDGTGTFTLKAFEGPGKRAYPEIEVGDVVETKFKVKEYNGELEGDALKLIKLSGTQEEYVRKKYEETLRERAKPVTNEFMIKDNILEKLKPSFIKAATEIRLAIIQNRPIIIRHHNDADGYSSGFTLERAILPLIADQHNSSKAAWEFFVRSPCQAPFYEIDDSIRDSSMSLRNMAKFSNKMPLVIIADNGSTEQDLFGIQQGKIHGMDFIVVDHHPFDKDVISAEVKAHINPFLVEESGDKFSAGMLCAELAHFITNVKNISQIPLMAGLADRIKNENAMAQYEKIAEKEGYSRELSNNIATVIDFVSAKLRFMEAREYIEVLFGEPRKQQNKLVDLMIPYIHDLESKGLSIAKSSSTIETMNNTTLQILDIEHSYPGFGFYPKPGKVVGLLHDSIQTEKKLDKVITAGTMSSAITFRATDGANFSVHEFMELVNKKIPGAFVNGGGHKNAGSVNFVPGKKEDILVLLREFIKNRK